QERVAVREVAQHRAVPCAARVPADVGEDSSGSVGEPGHVAELEVDGDRACTGEPARGAGTSRGREPGGDECSVSVVGERGGELEVPALLDLQGVGPDPAIGQEGAGEGAEGAITDRGGDLGSGAEGRGGRGEVRDTAGDEGYLLGEQLLPEHGRGRQ